MVLSDDVVVMLVVDVVVDVDEVDSVVAVLVPKCSDRQSCISHP